MSSDYPYRLRATITNPNPGAQDPETGVITLGGADLVLCDNEPGDWQDDIRSINTEQGGSSVLAYNAEWYFKNESLIYVMQPKAAFVVTNVKKPGWTKQGEVSGVRELDGVLEMTAR